MQIQLRHLTSHSLLSLPFLLMICVNPLNRLLNWLCAFRGDDVFNAGDSALPSTLFFCFPFIFFPLHCCGRDRCDSAPLFFFFAAVVLGEVQQLRTTTENWPICEADFVGVVGSLSFWVLLRIDCLSRKALTGEANSHPPPHKSLLFSPLSFSLASHKNSAVRGVEHLLSCFFLCFGSTLQRQKRKQAQKSKVDASLCTSCRHCVARRDC